MMKIESLNIGQAESIVDNHHTTFISCVSKNPTDKIIKLKTLGLVGDSVVDIEHGGEHMAVHVFSHDHYSFFNEKNGKNFPIPSFGENLTISALQEKQINVGDIWQLGNTVVQVSQPTIRCRTMGRALHQPKLLKWIHQEMMTGFYLRVLEEGEISKQSTIKILEKGPEVLNIDHLNQVLFKRPKSIEQLEKLCKYPVLSPRWKKSAYQLFNK